MRHGGACHDSVIPFDNDLDVSRIGQKSFDVGEPLKGMRTVRIDRPEEFRQFWRVRNRSPSYTSNRLLLRGLHRFLPIASDFERPYATGRSNPPG